MSTRTGTLRLLIATDDASLRRALRRRLPATEFALEFTGAQETVQRRSRRTYDAFLLGRAPSAAPTPARLAKARRDRGADTRANRWIVVGRIAVDPLSSRVHVDGQPVELTSIEFRLLNVLVRRAGAVVTRRDLVRSIWGDERRLTGKLNVHISRLRAKLGPAQAQIGTARGVGFGLAFS